MKKSLLIIVVLGMTIPAIGQVITTGTNEFSQVMGHDKIGVLRGIDFNMTIDEVKQTDTNNDEVFEYDTKHLRTTSYIGNENYAADVYYWFDEGGLYKIVVETFLVDSSNAADWMADASELYTNQFGESHERDGQTIWFVKSDTELVESYRIKAENISLPGDAGTRFEFVVSSADYTFNYDEYTENKPGDESNSRDVDYEISGAEYFELLTIPDRGNIFRGMSFNMNTDAVQNSESDFSYDGGSDNRYYLSIDLVEGGEEFADIDYEFDDKGLYGMFAETYMNSESAEERFFNYLIDYYTEQLGSEPKYDGSWATWQAKDEESKEKYSIGIRRLGYEGDSGVELQWMCRDIEYSDDMW